MRSSQFIATRRRARKACTATLVAGALSTLTLWGASPVTAHSPSETTYTVRENETLSHIAIRTGVSVADLVAANDLSDPDHVRSGQQIMLPVTSSVERPAVERRLVDYEVQPGDTLSVLALHAGVSTRELAELNNLPDRHSIRIGQTLTIPAGDGFALGASGSYDRLPERIVTTPERLALIPYFEKWAGANSIPVDLLMAIAWQESGWNNAALSNKGARGIGQLMPATERWVADSLIGHPELDAANPEDNIRISARYVRWLLDRMGDERLAIAAYYQGPGSVTAGGLFSSTEQYVENVLVHRQFFGAN